MALGCTRAKDPAGRQFPVADPTPGLAWKAPSDLWGVLSVLSTIVALMVPHSHTQHSWLAIMLVAKPITLSRLLKLRGDVASCWNWNSGIELQAQAWTQGLSALVRTTSITPIPPPLYVFSGCLVSCRTIWGWQHPPALPEVATCPLYCKLRVWTKTQLIFITLKVNIETQLF